MLKGEEKMEIRTSFSRGAVAIEHDLKDDKRKLSKNVSSELTKDNVVLINELKDYSINEYINKIMQPVIDEYNASQKRNDRKIKTDYVTYWKNNKNLSKENSKLAYEFVMSAGNHFNLGNEYYNAKSEADKEKLHKFFEDFYSKAIDKYIRKYPHQRVISAVIHFDEKRGTPHCHLTVIPIGGRYTRKLKHQISMGRALECDNIKRFEDMTEEEKQKYQTDEKGFIGYQLTRLEQDVRHEILNPLILERLKELKPNEEHYIGAETRGKKHTSVDMYREEIDKLTEQSEYLNQEINTNIARTKRLKDEIERLKSLMNRLAPYKEKYAGISNMTATGNIREIKKKINKADLMIKQAQIDEAEKVINDLDDLEL